MPKLTPIPEVGGRGRRGRRVTTSLSEINVVPLVDVMLVLLIIFMVAAPMLQRGIEVNLPVARQTQRLTDERMYITIPLAFRKDRRVYLDDEAVSVRSAGRTHPPVDGRARVSATSILRTDGEVQAQDILDVIDRLKEGGIEKVGIVALPKGR